MTLTRLTCTKHTPRLDKLVLVTQKWHDMKQKSTQQKFNYYLYFFNSNELSLLLRSSLWCMLTAKNANEGRVPMSSVSNFIFSEHEKFQIYLWTHMHMYTTCVQNFTWSHFYMQRTNKRQIHIFKLAFHFCYWAGIFYFVQHTNYNIFHEISQVLAEYIYVSVVFFSEFFWTFKYVFWYFQNTSSLEPSLQTSALMLIVPSISHD